MAVMETISEAELERIFLIGKIRHYECDSEYDYLIDYYIATGELPDDCELAKEILKENNVSLINDDIIS